MAAKLQTAIVQAQGGTLASQTLVRSDSEPVPGVTSSYQVLVRVLAVALNPNDHKLPDHFPMPGNGVGCDFCGVVADPHDVDSGSGSGEIGQTDPPLNQHHPAGTRVCGTIFPYSSAVGGGARPGAFAEWVVADSRLLLQVPEHWSDLQGAALGGVGWSTVALAMSHPDALGLSGSPSSPAEERQPVLVYGGGTATGSMACQLLSLCGYMPIAVVHSPASAKLAAQYGAAGIVSYTPDARCAEIVGEHAGGRPIRHVLDCITDAASAALCFQSVARTGGRYACLERFHDAWRSRRTIKVKEVMGYEVLGESVDLGASSIYTRERSETAVRIGREWAVEMQTLLDSGRVQPHPVQEIHEQWDGIIAGLAMLQSGKVRGHKLIVQISSVERK